jgi:hypothetical protein
MGTCLWLVTGLAALVFAAYRAGRIWVDAGQRGLDWVHQLGWALVGIALPSRYWWGARVEALSPQEQTDLLARETEALGLSRADSLRCPLCSAEVTRAWAVTPDGRPTIAPGPVECPRCDFRLDACRHCVHFLPGSPQLYGQLNLGRGDVTYGRCNQYKEPRPAEEVCPPEIARRLKARGWERIRSPTPIIDSFVPLDACTAFRPDRKRIRASEIRWPDARRVALLHMLTPPPALERPSHAKFSSDDEQWLP